MTKATSESKRARKTSRAPLTFKPHVQAFLREWILANRECPYPNGKERTKIRNATRLSTKQIRIWMANARRVSFTTSPCPNCV